MPAWKKQSSVIKWQTLWKRLRPYLPAVRKLAGRATVIVTIGVLIEGGFRPWMIAVPGILIGAAVLLLLDHKYPGVMPGSRGRSGKDSAPPR